MIQEEKNYIRFLDWEKYGVKVLYTQKSYGNVMEKSREDLGRDFSFENKIMITGKQIHSSQVACVENQEKFFLKIQMDF